LRRPGRGPNVASTNRMSGKAAQRPSAYDHTPPTASAVISTAGGDPVTSSPPPIREAVAAEPPGCR
jgi:hypothetical protein